MKVFCWLEHLLCTRILLHLASCIKWVLSIYFMNNKVYKICSLNNIMNIKINKKIKKKIVLVFNCVTGT